VSATASSPRWNELDNVELVEVHVGGMKGVIGNCRTYAKLSG
jgi:hypothetical protein